jgi:DNA-binding transcriptional regulator GbsR (MarR family)
LSDSFVSIFSDIAAEVGLSRPAGQCFAAIWRAPVLPCADNLTASLGLSRSNVSTALKELRAWGLVSVSRAAGDRREYFSAPDDPWDIIRVIIAARHRRSLAPVIDRLLAIEGAEGDAHAAALHDAASRIGTWLATLGKLDSISLSEYVDVGSISHSAGAKKKKKKRKG